MAITVDVLSRVGFASDLVDDAQRGGLVWALDAPADAGGLVLGTRLVTSLGAAPAARAGIAPPARAIVALLDIPASTPPGTHSLHVIHEGGAAPGILVAVPSLELVVLPASVSAGSDLVTGTPFALNAVLSVPLGLKDDVTTLFVQSVPRPTVEIHLSSSAWSAELDLTYPHADVALVDAVSWSPDDLLAENRPQGAWLRRTEAGRAELSAVGREAAFKVISLVFELKGAQPFDPNLACEPDCGVPCSGLRICSADFRNAQGAPITPTYTLEVR